MRLSTLPALALAGFLLTLLATPPQTARAATVAPDFTVTFEHTGNFETFTVPATGLYNITASGAQGGTPANFSGVGGLGAQVGGEVLLTQGTILSVAVGGQGISSGGFVGGGGGGSFVVGSGNTPLVIAGGGGGGRSQKSGLPGLAGTDGGSTNRLLAEPTATAERAEPSSARAAGAASSLMGRMAWASQASGSMALAAARTSTT